MFKYLFLSLVFIAGVVHADCPQLYPYNTPIVIPGAIELCNTEYVSLYDPTNRAVLLVSELVQPTGHTAVRKNAFHRDERVSNSPAPSEYLYSNYDKGHMAPADDSTSADEMHESFAMTNTTPQDPSLNRGRWRGLELMVRTQVSNSNMPTHVVTIASYGKTPQKLGNVLIPTGYAKVAYYESGTLAYYTSNTKTGQINTVTVDWINSTIPFAHLPR